MDNPNFDYIEAEKIYNNQSNGLNCERALRAMCSQNYFCVSG